MAEGIIIPLSSQTVGYPEESKKVGLQVFCWPQALMKRGGPRVAVWGMATSTGTKGLVTPVEPVIPNELFQPTVRMNILPSPVTFLSSPVSLPPCLSLWAQFLSRSAL